MMMLGATTAPSVVKTCCDMLPPLDGVPRGRRAHPYAAGARVGGIGPWPACEGRTPAPGRRGGISTPQAPGKDPHPRAPGTHTQAPPRKGEGRGTRSPTPR
jgi:hypothetical protein